MIRRLHIASTLSTGDEVPISGTKYHYLVRVLRMRSGSELEVFDGLGNRFTAKVTKIENQILILEVLQKCEAQLNNTTKIHLYQGLPKGSKMDLIVRMCTELGVDIFYPLLARRSVIDIGHNRMDKRMSRWSRVAAEAARQCRSSFVSSIAMPISIEQIPFSNKNELSLLVWEKEKNNVIDDYVSKDAIPDIIRCIIGPEGGFTEEEISIARSRGVQTVGLGDYILRTETAAVAVIAHIRLLLLQKKRKSIEIDYAQSKRQEKIFS